jgi:carboxylesterase
MSLIIPTAEPFYFPGGPIGCLLIHGFTGSPKEMHWMGEYLSRQGYTVLGIRLAGHATQPADMLRTRWLDWVASVEDGYNILDGENRPIFLMGLSMGGVLSLLFASHHPVAGIVAMSTVYALPQDWRLRLAKSLSLLKPTVSKGAPDWHNPEAGRDHVDYPYYPTRAIAELRDLLCEMRLNLPKVMAPTLLIHSRQDTGVPPENMDAIYNALGTRDKQMVWVEDSGHVITREPQRQRVFEAARDFVERVAGAAA